MHVDLPQDLTGSIAAAVRSFWRTRARQTEKQRTAGGKDQGARSAVTGVAQMNGFIDLFAKLALSAGARPQDVLRGTRAVLPGLFRPTMQWDLLVNRGAQVVCAFKFAGQTGPMAERHLDRLIQEAIGFAPELWGAYRRGAINFDIQPWLGYVLVVEDTRLHSNARSADDFCRRLVHERLYSDAAFVLVENGDSYTEPADDMTLERLCRTLVIRVSVYCDQPATALAG